MNTTTAAPPLSPADRCDRCGARALIRAILPGGGDLYFCAHHGREHAERLREVALEIQGDGLAPVPAEGFAPDGGFSQDGGFTQDD